MYPSREKVSEANTKYMVKTLQTHGMYTDVHDNQGIFNIEKKRLRLNRHTIYLISGQWVKKHSNTL